MLAIRMQRTGRKGHAMFRVVVQESRLTPTSGKVVALLGSYDPHGKAATLDKEKAALFLKNGAQPSDRAARLLKSEGVKLPEWVKLSDTKKRTIRNTDKLRKNRPVEEKPKAEESTAEQPATKETPAPEATETAEPTEAEDKKEA
ncbi:MAG TPA: 30S ribosomal protein S16 [Nevskiaceae bacterium]|nr:30S ribosomal protein S16 [Nevskiaceae bacterium]